MVRRVHQADPIGLEPIPERQRRMVQVLGGDADAAHGENSLDEIMVTNRGAQVLEAHGEVRVLHLPPEGILQLLVHTPWPVDVPLALGSEEGREEGEALNVVPVRVADEDMSTQRSGSPREERFAEGVGAGPAVEHDEGAIPGHDFHAGGVAPVAHRRGSRLRDRATRAPEANTHGVSVLSPRDPLGSRNPPAGDARGRWRGPRQVEDPDPACHEASHRLPGGRQQCPAGHSMPEPAVSVRSGATNGKVVVEIPRVAERPRRFVRWPSRGWCGGRVGSAARPKPEPSSRPAASNIRAWVP
jgi:hypothetical protein